MRLGGDRGVLRREHAGIDEQAAVAVLGAGRSARRGRARAGQPPRADPAASSSATARACGTARALPTRPPPPACGCGHTSPSGTPSSCERPGQIGAERFEHRREDHLPRAARHRARARAGSRPARRGAPRRREHVGPRAQRLAERTQQVHAALDPDERVVGVDLKGARERRGVHRAQARGVDLVRRARRSKGRHSSPRRELGTARPSDRATPRPAARPQCTSTPPQRRHRAARSSPRRPRAPARAPARSGLRDRPARAAASRATPPASKCANRLCGGMFSVRVARARHLGRDPRRVASARPGPPRSARARRATRLAARARSARGSCAATAQRHDRRCSARAHSSSPRPLTVASIVGRRNRALGVSSRRRSSPRSPRARPPAQLVGDLHALADGDPGPDDGVVLHVAHRHEAMDVADAEPVQHVRHQLLEAHVLHARDALGAREVGVGAVAALLALARVVDQELGHLAERAALLARSRRSGPCRPPAPCGCTLRCACVR